MMQFTMKFRNFLNPPNQIEIIWFSGSFTVEYCNSSFNPSPDFTMTRSINTYFSDGFDSTL